MSFPPQFALQDIGYSDPSQYVCGHYNGDISSTTLNGPDGHPEEMNWSIEPLTDGSCSFRIRNVKYGYYIIQASGSFGLNADSNEAAIFAANHNPSDWNRIQLRVTPSGTLFDGFAYSKSGGYYQVKDAFA